MSLDSSNWRPAPIGTPAGRELSEHSYAELAALHAIARILAQPEELKYQLQQALEQLSRRMGMERGMISLIDRETGEAWLDVAYGVNIEGLDVSYRPGEGITGRVAQTGRPLACGNLGQEPHFLDRTGSRRSLNRSDLTFLCVPIIYNAQVVGVLSADKVTAEADNFDRELAFLSSVAELLAKAVQSRAIEEDNRRLRRLVDRSRASFTEIIAYSRVMQEVFTLVSQVADSNTTVLINGETGTGKELIARAIHKNSSRLKGPLVQVNCAAIPDTLIESELFGHEKGAFTGALQQRRGRFEEANGGTIFLDEVGELSAAAQAKLLRVLQEKQFQPLGSSRTVKVDVRIIAATNRNLEQDLATGRFRPDLFYRLNVFPIHLPPLRERGGDIVLLAEHFVKKYATEMGKPVRKLSPALNDVLLSYPWPGNVRELENCMERAVLLALGDTIELADLPPAILARTGKNQSAGVKESGKFDSTLEAQERALIIAALKETRGNQSKAALQLGITKRIIQYRIKKLGLDYRQFKTGK